MSSQEVAPRETTVYPDGKYCPECNYDLHRCPGCGESLPHGTRVCEDCKQL